MKKLVMLSHESVFSGNVKSGMAEMVDSLANSLSQQYAVTIVCINGHGTFARAAANLRTIKSGVQTCRFSAVDYYMLDRVMWPNYVADIVNELKPDILHNFAEPELLGKMATRPQKAIYTFDHVDYVRGKEQYLVEYDSVTTVSKNYSNEVLYVRDTLAQTLSTLDFHGVTNGILTAAFAPEKGLLIPAKYTSNEQSGKELCKKRLLQTYGIQGNPYVCLMMCRLVKEKGLDDVFAAVSTIKESGGVLIIVGKGDAEYEKQLESFKHSDGLIYVGRWASPVQAAPLTAGADFYLCPSDSEPCGLMPMTASRYGAVPIVSQNGGLTDNFNNTNAIVIENGLVDAIERAAALYSDSEALTAMRKICMEKDFSWNTRKQGYIDLYEKETGA